MKRVVVYPKDIMVVTGKSERHSRTLLKRMKQHYKKEEYQYITISELCQYMGLDEVVISNMIK
jgi:hypothetical protein